MATSKRMLSTARKTPIGALKDLEFISSYLRMKDKGYYGRFLGVWAMDDLKWRESMPAYLESYVLEQLKFR